MKTQNEIKLNFECQETWDAMPISEHDRFCTVCSKEVIDFTAFSRASVLEKIKLNEQLCGRFNPEHLDSSLIKPIDFKVKINFFALISSLLIAVKVNASSANSFKNTVIEQVEKQDSLISVENNRVKLNEKSKVKEELKPDKPKKPFLKMKKRQFYWSRKFPFIKVVKRVKIMGGIGRRL
jgi:hypothetical protein